MLIAAMGVATAAGADHRPTYVTTDVETINGFVIDATVTCPITPGTYVSGGNESCITGRAPVFGECGLSFECPIDMTVSEALAAPDHFWAHLINLPIVLDMGAPTDAVFVFNAADHGPFPEEGIEWTVWGSDSPDVTSFPSGWTLGTLCAIFKQGWVESGDCPGDDADDFTGIFAWTQPFRYVAVFARGSITIFRDRAHTTWAFEFDDDPAPGWQSDDAELDAVARPAGPRPTADAGPDLVVSVGEKVTLDGTGSSGNILRYSWDTDGDLVVDETGSMVSVVYDQPGTYQVSLFVVGECGCASDTKVVEVTENRPPDCRAATADPPELWPPNHKLVPVGIVGVTDPDGDELTITVTGVTQDEELNGLGDGNTCPDAVIHEDGRVSLRAERSGRGNGRVYVISFTATDPSGGTCSGTVSVCVPHDQRPGSFAGSGPSLRPLSECVDDGQSVNSLGPCSRGRGALTGEEPVATIHAATSAAVGGRVTVEYRLSRDAEVMLAVFDITGRRVATLDRSHRRAGTHQASWDTGGLAAGVYFYRLLVDDVPVSKPVLVLK